MKWWNGHESLVWLIITYKNSNCCGHLLNLGGKSPRMHLCLGKLITEILWVQLTSLRSFVAVKKEMWEWTRGGSGASWRRPVDEGPDGKSSTCCGSTVRFWRLSHCCWRGRAASVSLSSHSVSGNDAELWAVFQEHVSCAWRRDNITLRNSLMEGFTADAAANSPSIISRIWQCSCIIILWFKGD